MGTARIAADPREGVCAADGSVNGVAGLYVADASLFPTSVGVNPMMTIIAFAKQVAAGSRRSDRGCASPLSLGSGEEAVAVALLPCAEEAVAEAAATLPAGVGGGRGRLPRPREPVGGVAEGERLPPASPGSRRRRSRPRRAGRGRCRT